MVIIEIFVPHITFQNRIDKFTVFSGQPRISGGNELVLVIGKKIK